MIYLGIDWAEAHHDGCLLDDAGTRLGKARVPDGIEGLARIHELVGEHTADPLTVVVGIETDRGLLVQGLVATGYQVYALNPFAVSRYRDRHTVSHANSDPGDAKVLAELVRTDRQNHRPLAGDSELAEALKILARAHQTLIWTRGRQMNQLRSTLREFYPAALDAVGTDLAGRDALARLSRAPTPEQGRQLSLNQLGQCAEAGWSPARRRGTRGGVAAGTTCPAAAATGAAGEGVRQLGVSHCARAPRDQRADRRPRGRARRGF